MRKKFRNNVIQFFVACGLMVGCSHGGQRTETGTRSLIEIQRLVEVHLPAGKRAVSQNRREYFSNYFVRGGDEGFKEAGAEPVRYTAHILILGDRRPYTVEVRVYKERRQPNGQFEQFGYDEGLARVIFRRLEKALHQRREERNIIDEFRVF